jgi:hypothetical protein
VDPLRPQFSSPPDPSRGSGLISPYFTLVSAYERLIHARGREVGPEIAVTSQPVAHALPEDAIKPDPREGSGGEEN